MKLYLSDIRLTILCIILLTVSSCGGGSRENRVDPRWTGNTIEEEHVPDSMVRVCLNDMTDDSLYVTLLHTKDKMAYSYRLADDGGQIKGSLTPGNIYSILPKSHENRIDYAVNLTELFGKWYYDMDQHRGFVIGSQGSLSSINPEDFCLKRWMLRNGQWLVFYVYTQQVADRQCEFEVEISEIKHLSADELSFMFKGKLLKCHHSQELIKYSRK